MSRASSVYQLLGLARRAGALASGTAAVRHAIKVGDARLVLMADDASPHQLDKIRRALRQRPIPQARMGDRASLGAAIGLAPVSAVALTSRPLADRLLSEVGEGLAARSAERDAAGRNAVQEAEE